MFPLSEHLTWCEVFDAERWHAGETLVGVSHSGVEGREVACLLVVAVAGLARGAGAADDDVGGQGWAGAVGGVGWGGGADEVVRAGVAVGGEVSLVGFGARGG